MKRTLFALALILAPMIGFSQGYFDKFEDENDVTAVIVTKNMFKLLAEIDIESDDPEVREYMEMVNNLEDIKIFITDNSSIKSEMKNSVNSYISSNKNLNELMRVKEDGKFIKFCGGYKKVWNQSLFINLYLKCYLEIVNV